jgi:hypothetical protein
MGLTVGAAYVLWTGTIVVHFQRIFFLVLDAYAINLGGIGEQLKL